MARRAKRAPTKKRTARRPKQRSTEPATSPQGLRTVTPYLVIDGASKAIDFYKKAFGAKEIDRSPMPDGTLMHATIRIGDSIIMMSDEMPGADSKSPTSAGATTVNLHIYSNAVDKLWNQAINAGAKPTLPLENQFWGERYGKLQDPFGHIWSVSMVVKMSEQEKEAKRRAAFEMMSGGEHPGSEKSWS
ncbi:MAG: VOC family protein [Methanobacteriota archaeon]|nr:MAG: VOC family protein [Euryarchaeota archaeon]